MAEVERNLTPETSDRGRGDASGKRAVKSSCNDAPGVRAEKGSCEGVAVAAQGGCLEQEGNAPQKSRLFCVCGGKLRSARFLSGASASALSRLYETHCTGCAACTSGIAFNGGSESRLRMPVGRAPDVARGPRALRDDLPVCMCELALDVPSQNIWKSFL